MKSLPDHLGGHKNRTHIDIGILKYAMNELGCKSMLDIGCGVGGQVYEAHKLGFDARGIDGDFTIEYEMPELFESHDFTKGKFEFKSHFDMVWCCEFIEHIKKDYEDNWLSLMQNAKYVFVTYSEPNTPGHHHVNCEEKPYCVELFKKYGFSFRQDLTDTSKTFSTMEREFWMSRGLIFINHNG